MCSLDMKASPKRAFAARPATRFGLNTTALISAAATACRFPALRLGVVAAASLMAAPGHAADTVVKSFASGTARNQVGMVDAAVDTEIDGPQAIYAADDGNLYLLDQVNSRVLRFDAKRPSVMVQSLELPAELRPTDLVVRRGSVYVWDGSPHALQAGGRDDDPVRDLIQTRSIEPPDAATLSAFAQMGSQELEAPADLLSPQTRSIPLKRAPARQVIASRGRGTVTADVTLNDQLNAAEVDLREQASNTAIAKLRLKVQDRIGAVEFLEIDNAGRLYVLTENIPTNSKRPSAAFVVRFSPQGALEAVYDIPLDQSVALSRRFIAVSTDGDVYFLRTRKNEVDVIGVGSRKARANAIIDNPNAPRLTEAETRIGKGPIAAVRPLSRQQVVATAFAFEGLQWRVTPAVYGRDPDTACTGFNRIRRPGYLSGRLNQEVRGVPYCWGCHGSLAQFEANINRGMLAGNVCTHNDPRPDVTGVDCSAFVSATWGLANHFTTAAIPAITTELQNAWDLQPGDALNKPGSHVMLFLRFTADRKAEVMESSTGGCNGRVCRNVYPLASLLARGYKPVRFRALEGDVQTAALASTTGRKPDTAKAAEAPPRVATEERVVRHHHKHKKGSE
jgi:hypothetical protein